jgi:Na+/H+-translocating membrane pyrophosphatase
LLCVTLALTLTLHFTLQIAFKAGMVMGFSLVALATGMLIVLYLSYKAFAFNNLDDAMDVKYLVECLAGYVCVYVCVRVCMFERKSSRVFIRICILVSHCTTLTHSQIRSGRFLCCSVWPRGRRYLHQGC